MSQEDVYFLQTKNRNGLKKLSKIKEKHGFHKDNGRYDIILRCNLCNPILLQLFSVRSKMVRKCEEKYWQQLFFGCMSEEDSANEDENNDKFIVRHTPTWRSGGNRLLPVKLDSPYFQQI